jgi:abhydrolase domain-containing protein 12
MLRDLGYHILSFDYRSFADSDSALPTESGTVANSRTVFNFARDRAGKKVQIFLWGHWLGSRIATALAADVTRKKQPLAGLVWELPFNNIGDEFLGPRRAI